MRLYDLSEQYNDLLEMVEQDADNEVLRAMLDGLEGAIEQKVEAILSVRNAKRAEVKALRDESARLAQRAAQVEKEANRLEEMVEYALNTIGAEKLKTLKFTVWMQSNPPSVMVLDETQVPKEFYTVPEPQIAKKNILEAWKNGQLVPGVEIRQEKSLRVR